eukprot:TRINITY_DN59271_c0_g1_i1.p1 TRINITY_DN59271_c0_g1~~TRINITY_DN59271_c0_g1_i1.p1  ORF type:complete len:335 (-),score=84.61 TRINITY_DN59271_c0_g1_i1:168-1172(-)
MAFGVDQDEKEEVSALLGNLTREELEARQQAEVDELAEKSSAHLAAIKSTAGKGKKGKAAIEAAERLVSDWEYELTTRHNEELQSLFQHSDGGVDEKGACNTTQVASNSDQLDCVSGVAAATNAEADEEERARRKKEKSLKKKQSRSAKDAEREAEREREKLAAGPSARELELKALITRLEAMSPPLWIHEVAADGHCLYRSVGDQLKKIRPDLHQWERRPELIHEEVRAVCARSLRQRSEDYMPFAELADGEDFEGYCDRVERSADWGGELELRALADMFSVRIIVHRAEAAEPLVIGNDRGNPGDPLQVAFHRYYYALGEHYNSVLPGSGSE